MKKYLLILLFVFPFVSYAQVDNCFCVTFVRQFSPAVPRLNASEWHLLPRELRSIPVVGGQILLEYENKVWHVAHILELRMAGVWVREDWCGVIRERLIEWNDPDIRAFFDF